MQDKKTLVEIVSEVAKGVHCNCDLDNWQPQTDTGHTWVCRIDVISRTLYKNQNGKVEYDEDGSVKVEPKISGKEPGEG